MIRAAVVAGAFGLALLVVRARRRAAVELAPLLWQRHLDLQRLAREAAAKAAASPAVPDPPLPDDPPFVCPDCGRASWHPRDRAEGYCGRCHAFTGARR